MIKGCAYVGPDEPRGCDANAEWEIASSTPGVLGVTRTFACTAHAGALFTKTDIQFVYRLP